MYTLAHLNTALTLRVATLVSCLTLLIESGHRNGLSGGIYEWLFIVQN